MRRTIQALVFLVKMSRASDGKTRYTNTRVGFGSDAKQTLKLPEKK